MKNVSLSERFFVLTTLTDRHVTDRMCALLEDEGIPVLIEHVEILEDDIEAFGYRMLVPGSYIETASSLIQVPEQEAMRAVG